MTSPALLEMSLALFPLHMPQKRAYVSKSLDILSTFCKQRSAMVPILQSAPRVQHEGMNYSSYFHVTFEARLSM